MDRGTIFKTLVLLVLALLITNAQGQTAKDLVGEWEFKMDMQGRQMVSQVEFTLKDDGTLAGKWTSSGMGGGGVMESELANIKFVEGKITFDRTIVFGENEFTMSYSGVYKDGTITGGFNTEMGDMPTNGTKKAPPFDLVGEWEFVMQFGNRGGRGGQRAGGQQRAPRPPTKIVFAKKEDGTFTGTWEGGMMGGRGGRGGRGGGQRAQATGPAVLTEIKLEDNKLTFIRKMQMQDRDMSMNFAGTVDGDTITGGMTMAMMGEGQQMPATLTRVKPLEVLGDWEVTIAMGEREFTFTMSFTQNEDGTLAGKSVSEMGESAFTEVKFEGQTLTYKQVRTMGEQEMTSMFAGTIEGDVLTGKITTGDREIDITGKRKVK